MKIRHVAVGVVAAVLMTGSALAFAEASTAEEAAPNDDLLRLSPHRGRREAGDRVLGGDRRASLRPPSSTSTTPTGSFRCSSKRASRRRTSRSGRRCERKPGSSRGRRASGSATASADPHMPAASVSPVSHVFLGTPPALIESARTASSRASARKASEERDGTGLEGAPAHLIVPVRGQDDRGSTEPAAARCVRRSRPLIPGIRRSTTRQPVFGRCTDSRKASAETKVSTRKPTDVSRFLTDRRSDSSSSTMETSLITSRLVRGAERVYPTLVGSATASADPPPPSRLRAP